MRGEKRAGKRRREREKERRKGREREKERRSGRDVNVVFFLLVSDSNDTILTNLASSTDEKVLNTR